MFNHNIPLPCLNTGNREDLMERQIIKIAIILMLTASYAFAAKTEIKSEDLIQKIELSNMDIAKSSLNNKGFVEAKVKKQNLDSQKLSKSIIDNIFSKTRSIKDDRVSLRSEVIQAEKLVEKNSKLISANKEY